MDTCILSTVYWGPVQYYTKLLSFSHIYVEQWETYPKQTFRNRCVIYGPNGAQPLMVPVEKGSFHKILTKDIKLSYDTTWIKNHLKSLEAAYRSSPFYEYYMDDIWQLYQKPYTFLLDLNWEILQLTLKWLKMEMIEVHWTKSFEIEGNFSDFRMSIHPKAGKMADDTSFKPITYTQGFEQRFGFIPNLSILDLIFNTGPEARTIFINSSK